MIFLTGATGLVGSFVCRKLLQEGCQIKALKRSTSDLSLLKDVADQIEWVEGDLLDILSLQQAIQGCDTVVHNAGFVSYHKSDADKMQKINGEGTANIVNTALRLGVKRFVHMSSVAAIGRSSKAKRIDEKFKWSDADEHTAYGNSKHQAELEVFRGGMEGLEVIALNPVLVLGPGSWDKSSTQLFKYVYEERPFYTDGTMNYVDARDLANITFAAVQGKLKAGERYIISAGSISYKQFFERVAKCFNKKKPSIRVNPSLLKGAFYFESLRSALMGKAPLITRETLKLAKQDIIFENKKLRQALDYQFISIEDTIDWTCQNLKS